MIGPDRKAFGTDPIGYGGLAWLKWETARLIAEPGYQPREEPTKEDLKNPVLWLTQAQALTEAAAILVRTEPTWETMPPLLRGVCDSQFCAVALMLVGYSLETCLKAVLILRHGVDQYLAQEREFHHHRLEELANFLPDLTEKDQAILKALTHFTMWAGRYPDPGSNRVRHASEILVLSERHQIAGRDLFALASSIMRHVQAMTQ
jgi:hypothetical protein